MLQILCVAEKPSVARQLAAKFLRLSSNECMRLAENLYNRGIISYPRTETDAFSGMVLPVAGLKLVEGVTTPPKSLDEAGLLVLLDRYGIGTDATMHEHIKNVILRNYVEKKSNGQLVPTKLGFAISLVFARHFPDLISVSIRSKLEAQVKAIAHSTCHVIASLGERESGRDFARRGRSICARTQALVLNAMAANSLKILIASSLGPKGRFKTLVSGGGELEITKDGNCMLKNMQIQHPTAAMLARAAVAQDTVTGDGSCTVILLIGSLLEQARRYYFEGIHPRHLSAGLDFAKQAVLKYLDEFAVAQKLSCESRDLLFNVARSSLCTKVKPTMAQTLAGIIVKCIHCLCQQPGEAESSESLIPLDLYMVEVLPIKVGTDPEVEFFRGMVMDHGCRHPAMPTSLENCFVLTCNVSLEYEKTEVNSSFVYSDAKSRSELAQAERSFTTKKVQQIIDLKRRLCTAENGKNFVVMNQKGIDPAALEMLAKERIMALRRVKRRNMERITYCCGGSPVNSVDGLQESDLGFAESCWEISLGDEKYTFLKGRKNPRSCCIVIKAAATYEVSRIKEAIRDALRACKNALDDQKLVPGAGAFEFAAATHLQTLAAEQPLGKNAYGVQMLAESLLAVPKALAQNAGLNAQDMLQRMKEKALASRGATPREFVGLDLDSGRVMDPTLEGVWDGYSVKKQTVNLAVLLAQQLVLIDEIIRAGKNMSPAQQS
uniref:T-complex protein 1 subunit zeta-like n=1 Tax=Dermatophagoides pteronyssinus TaxID=6956 RepID=A0A6P6Y9M5_DERPT|nr:T-complex protein 1 subunit zeta-like [Dermatophagoides pteronyssinus]